MSSDWKTESKEASYLVSRSRSTKRSDSMRELAEGCTESAEIDEERQEHRLSMALAKVAYDRRIELGLSQTELAARAGLTL